jgi:DNA-binding response OmpR family regulator
VARILVVEDNPEIGPMIRQLIVQAGAVCEWASTGAMGMALYWWALAQESPYHGIVLDLALPKMDGLSVAERVRGIEGEGLAPRAYIYALTGYSEHMLSGESLARAGLDLLREKPGDPDELCLWVQDLRKARGEKA